MSAAKRSLSARAPTDTDIMNDPRVTRQQLRFLKVRLREIQSRLDETTSLNVEKELDLRASQRIVQRWSEAWAGMEDGIREIAGANNVELPPPAVAAEPAASSSTSNAVAAAATTLAASPNPVLRMLAARWSALTGRDGSQISAAAAESASAVAAASGTPEESKDEEMRDEGEDGADDDEMQKRQKESKNAQTEAAGQAVLQQRSAFAQSLLAALVQRLPPAAPPATPSEADLRAQLLALHSERLTLRARAHAAENEVQLLTSTLAERDTAIDAEREKNKQLQRRVERMSVDAEDAAERAKRLGPGGGDASSAAAASSAPSARSGMSSADSVPLNSVPDARPLSPTSLLSSTAISPAILSAPSRDRYTDADFHRLKEDLLETRRLAKSRLDDLQQAHKQVSLAEMATKKAAQEALQDERAIEGTRSWKMLHHAHTNLKVERERLRAENEVLHTQITGMQGALDALRADHASQMSHAQQRFDDTCARATENLSQQVQANALLQKENSDLATALAASPDASFYTSMKNSILPELDAAVKRQAASLALAKEERLLAAQAIKDAGADGADESDVRRHVGKILRTWKEQERKLQAEKAALTAEVTSLRAAPSSGAPGSAAAAAAAAEASQLRVKLSAAEHEVVAIRAELAKLQSASASSSSPAASSSLAELQSSLENAEAMQSALASELNELTDRADEQGSSLQRLNAAVQESSRNVDRIRTERQNTALAHRKWMEEQKMLRAQAAALQGIKELADKNLAVVRGQNDALQREGAKAKDLLAAMQASVDSARTAAQAAANDATDARAKLAQVAATHETCETTIKEVQQKQAEALAAAQKSKEAVSLLKGRISRLQEQVSSLNSSSSGSSNAAGSGDAARIRSLQLTLNCKVCEINPKDRVITKCMHAICAECVKKNLDSRLRKCPTCGIKFGDNDVRPLFL